MENEQITIALTVAQCNALLTVIGAAPWTFVTQNADPVNSFHAQFVAQVTELQKKAEPAVAEQA